MLLRRTDVNLGLYKPSLFYKSKVDGYLSLREFKEALSVIADARPVAENSLIHSDGLGMLNRDELEKLQKYRDKLLDSILHIIGSNRSDKGHVLLIQAARFQAISRSLESGCLITLDPFSENAESVTQESLSSSYIAASYPVSGEENPSGSEIKTNKLYARNYLEQIIIDQKQDVLNAKYHFFSGSKDKDISFNQLETSLGRLWEIENAKNNNGRLRVEGGVLTPCKSGSVNTSFCIENRENIAISQKNEALFKKQLYELYNYNLVYKNCVTELFDTIYSCFSTAEQARKELGGYFNSGMTISFVPFYAFYSVKQKFPDASIEIFPSYRTRQKEMVYRQEGLWGLLKETNTITSSIYFPWEGDSSFLFFTDDSILTRPLFGIGNTAFATVNMAAGAVLTPVDRGRLLKRSMRGIVFSLPELFFFNIRKGTFPATSLEN